MALLFQRTNQIAENQVLGNFEALVKEYNASIAVGASDFGGFWANMLTDEGSVMLNATRAVSRAIKKQLDGVEDDELRKAIVINAFKQCSVLEINATEQLTDEERKNGLRAGKVIKNPDGSTKKRWVLSQQSDRIAAEELETIATAAPAFVLKHAMSNRV